MKYNKVVEEEIYARRVGEFIKELNDKSQGMLDPCINIMTYTMILA